MWILLTYCLVASVSGSTASKATASASNPGDLASGSTASKAPALADRLNHSAVLWPRQYTPRHQDSMPSLSLESLCFSLGVYCLEGNCLRGSALNPGDSASGYTALVTSHNTAGRGCPGSQSAAGMMLDIPRTTTSLGDRAFAIAGLHVWNSLPPVIRDPSLSLSVFGKMQKTNVTHWWHMNWRLLNVLTD